MSLPTLAMSALLCLTLSTGCTKTTYLKNDSEVKISEIQKKIDDLTQGDIDALLKECQWLFPMESNTQEARVQAITNNIERQIECYYLNEAKLQFLKVLQEYKNGRWNN